MALTAPLAESPMVEQIIEGAERAFLTGGYEATTMDSIARQAGVARASVYNNFATKDALFLAVMRRGIEQFVDRALSDDETRLLPWERLHRVAATFLREACSSDAIEMYRVVVAQGPRFPGLSQALYERGLKRIEERLRDIASLAGERVRDPDRFAGQLLAILMGETFSAQLLGVAPKPDLPAIKASVDEAISALAAHLPLTSQTLASLHASPRA